VCDDHEESPMTKDGDAMHVHDLEVPEHQHRPGNAIGQQDAAWQAARRAAAAGHARAVEPRAMLHLQRLAGNAGVASLVDHDTEEGDAGERRSPVLDVVGRGGGSPLPTDVRADMEAGLGADFGDVRVHDDGPAAASAQAVSARAYTVGNDVVFNRGAYQPDTTEGRQTLAHELTHVVQQRSGPVDGTSTGDGVALSDPHDRFEQEAESKAASFGHGSEPVSAAPASSVQRQVDDEDVGAQSAPLQRQTPDEEEDVGAQAMSLQRQDVAEDEEDVGAQTLALQRQDAAEDEEEMTAPA
jgi:hypothetical protein